jgi:hypothetical protein
LVLIKTVGQRLTAFKEDRKLGKSFYSILEIDTLGQAYNGGPNKPFLLDLDQNFLAFGRAVKASLPAFHPPD